MFGQNKSFGSGSFGSSSGGGLFGQNNQNKGLFGQTTNQNTSTSSIFGSNQNKPAGSLFGGASNTTSNLFGSPQTQNNQSSLFGGGQNNANRSLFGGASTSTTTGGSLFGGASNTNNAGTSSIFGSNNNASGSSSLFGGGSSVSGTTIKFDPPINSDTMMRNGTTQTISTKHMCISAMNKYSDKSIEELRVEDYMQNRKAPAAGTTTTSGGGLFGTSNTTTNQSGGLFGNSNTTQQKSLFGGTSTSSPFGGTTNNTTTGGGLFGNANANTSGTGSSLFGGAKPAGSSLFGGNTAPTTGGTTFGQSSGSSLFGGNQQQQSGSLFGQTQSQPQTGSLFGGNTASTGTGLFGQTNQNQQQSSGFNFGGGSTTTNAFGQPAAASTGGNLFGNTGNTNTGGSLFGSKPATSTGFNFGGSQPTTTTAFGGSNTTGGGLFGSNAAKPGGLFGNNTNVSTGGGLFGSQPQASTGGIFGSNTQNAQPLSTGFGNLAQPQVVVQQQVAPVPVIGVTADVLQMQANMKSLQSQLTNTPYGDSPLLKYNKESEAKESPISTQQRQLRFLAAKKGSLSNGTPESSFIVPPISKVMSDLSPALSKPSEVVKDLNYTSKEAPPTLGRGLRNSTYNPNLSLANQSVHDSSALNRTIDSTLNASLNGTSSHVGPRGSVRKSNLKQLDLSLLSDTSRVGSAGRDNRTSDPDALPRISESERRSDIVTSTPSAADPAQAVMQRHQERNRDPPSLNLDTTCDEHTGLEPISATSSVTSVASTPSEETPVLNTSVGVRLSKPDYFSLPTINEMKGMVKNGRVVLEDGLTIGRSSYGSVFWPGRIELKNIVLDEIVVFRHKEVTVYPNEEEKPAEGEELNRPAEVTLERVWYTDKKTKKEIRDVVKLAEVGWREHLERNTIRMGATFKDYRAETGSWVFRVEHFSKYGLADDDDEPMEIAPSQNQQAPLQTIDLNSSAKDVNSQVQRKKVHKTPDAHLREALKKSPGASLISSPESHPDAIPIVRRRNLAGLGGGTSLGSENNRLSNAMNEFQNRQRNESVIEEDVSSFIIEEGEQPEKKPKLEILNELEYESSRFIRNMQELRVMPQPIEPEHQFHGGSRAAKMIGFGKSKLIDMGLMKGRTCHVGWSEVGSLVWSAQPNQNQILWGTVDRSSDVNARTLAGMLDVNIHFSESRRKGPSTNQSNNASFLTSSFVTYPDSYAQMFLKYIDIAHAGGYDGHASVWRLLSALFPSQRLDGWSFERGEQIGEWLKEEAMKQAPEERTSRDTSTTAVWNQLCLGDTERAFQAAINHGQPKLASILQSSMVCPESTIHCFKAQIDNWRKCEVLHLISKPTLKCYILMAGMSHYEWTHEGQKHSVNCLEGLSWIQALGIHVWYLRQWTGLEEAYESYQKDVVAGRAASNRGDLYGELIKLACEAQHSVETVLDCAAGESPHDHFLQWHVWSVLYSVGFRTMSKVVETRLHRSYSTQLEAARLSKYAVFVLQHIDDDEERATGVRNLLDRIARFNDNRLFEVISHKFDIPAFWIAEAQFATAKMNEDGAQLFELAVSAKNLLEMRRYFVDDIAPTAVVAGDNDALRTACNMIRKYEDVIPEWGATGMVYTDYCRLLDYIDADVDDELKRELLDTIEMRLHAPNDDKTTIQRLALQTIGRQVFDCRRNKEELTEWGPIIGQRQLYKAFRERTSWGVERFAIEFE